LREGSETGLEGIVLQDLAAINAASNTNGRAVEKKLVKEEKPRALEGKEGR